LQRFLGILIAIIAACTFAAPASAEVTELRISRQPGLSYLPLMIMEQQKLIETEARKRGLGDLKVSWLTFNGGGAGIDALLSGNVDLVTSGSTNLLTVWARSNGTVKGVSGAGALPMLLVTRNPNVHTLRDFTAADKIALPTVGQSTQMAVLQIAAEKTFGPGQERKLDSLCVSLGHPDALVALASGKDVDAHFSLPPYQELELKLPGVHTVINSVDVLGGPASNGVVFGTTKFHDANPKTIAAVVAAVDDAVELIAKDKRLAAELYLRETKEKISVEDLAAMLASPQFVYSTAPQGTFQLADLMYRLGTIKTRPASWKDYFFSDVHGRAGS
jgi:NitT/TauT family transport system substrate-binding protein